MFDRVKERQRLSKKARAFEPTLAGRGQAKAIDVQPLRSEQTADLLAKSAESALSGGSPLRRQGDQRRTDAPCNGAVRQGAPCTPKKDESSPLSSEKKPLQRLETPTTYAVGERSHVPDRAAWQKKPDAPRDASNIHSAIRQTVGTHNFLATHGIESYDDILVGVRTAQANHSACRDEIIHTQAEIDRLKVTGAQDIKDLRELEKCASWCLDLRDVAEQFEKLKLFRGRFYQNHKNEIDKFNYASKKLQAAGYNDHVVPESFKHKIAGLKAQQAERIQRLEARRDKLTAKWEELREELRLWTSAEIYMRELLDLPEPEQLLPIFSVPSGPEPDSIQAKLQRISDLARERKQKAPVKSHQRDDRGR